MSDKGEHVAWLDAPQEHDYPAAAAYLQLVAAEDLVDGVIAELRAAATIRWKAKDLLRASGLPALDRQNVHVAGDLRKIALGHALSPVLLVRGSFIDGVALQIADGYHRICASYYTDENTDIPCRLAAGRPSSP